MLTFENITEIRNSDQTISLISSYIGTSCQRKVCIGKTVPLHYIIFQTFYIKRCYLILPVLVIHLAIMDACVF